MRHLLMLKIPGKHTATQLRRAGFTVSAAVEARPASLIEKGKARQKQGPFPEPGGALCLSSLQGAELKSTPSHSQLLAYDG
jgi:hypothetical protein